MIENLFLTTKDKDAILNNITIIIDSREQSNRHIVEYFNEKGISYDVSKLEVGDYSFKLRNALGSGLDFSFEREFAIERKNSLEELSGNFTTDRLRFEKEFMSAKCRGTALSLVVEDASINNVFDGTYNTQYNKKSFIASILSYKYRYGVDFNFVNKDDMGRFIFLSSYYFLREKLK